MLLFLWFGTAHQSAWRNENLLLFNPLCLLLLVGAIPLLRKRAPSAWFRWLLAIVAGLAAVAWILHWLPLALQYNQSWVALLLPVHAALAYVFFPQRSLLR